MGHLQGVHTALITGASRGIGAEFARQLAAKGHDLVLVARARGELETLGQDLAARHGIEARVIGVDLAQPSAAMQVWEETEQRGLVIDLVVNNAGFARVGCCLDLPLEVQADMVRLNVNTLVELTGLYLPGLRQRGRGGVINVASTAAFQPVPFMAIYGATKAFVLSYSEALAAEVAGCGIGVMALCPGATATDFWAVAGAGKVDLDRMPAAEQVVRAGLEAFGRGKPVFVPGPWNKLMTIGTRLGPRRLVVSLAARFLQNRL